ncbi:9950_t:CDS:2 [Entrophospora sp. SA101]|nr:9950_t:CDS:2 [Entrophospora sp. SA101]
MIAKYLPKHYYVPIEDARRRIREIDSSQEDPEFLPFISEKLRKLADMPKPEKEIENLKNDLKNDLLKEIKNKLNHNNHYNEQMLQTLLADDLKEIKMSHENLKNDLNHNNEQMLQTLLAEIKNLKK